MIKNLRRRRESGATAIEYGLLAALVAVVIITAVTLLGTTLSGVFGGISSAIGGATGGAGGVDDSLCDENFEYIGPLVWIEAYEYKHMDGGDEILVRRYESHGTKLWYSYTQYTDDVRISDPGYPDSEIVFHYWAGVAPTKVDQASWGDPDLAALYAGGLSAKPDDGLLGADQGDLGYCQSLAG